MDTMRSVPSRSVAFRSPSADAASSKLTSTGRFSVTIRLARISASTTWSSDSSGVSKSSVEASRPKWTLIVAWPVRSASTAESRC